MKPTDTGKRSIGVNFTNNGAEVLLWSPKATKAAIQIVGGGLLALDQQEYGYWSLSTQQIKPGDKYKFVIDDQQLPDPASLSQPAGVHEYSEAFDVNAFEWTDDNWHNPPLATFIMYELHTGTFTEAGTFAALSEKLDYLVELGVNAIEIMPVAQFPGDRNWGYDGVYPYAVQSTYGGPQQLQQLVDNCHAKGIAVILDVVYNHLGPEGNYLPAFGPYFTEKYHTPWGNALNFDDEWCDGVRKYFIENVLMWFRDFHIDGLRLDAVHAIKDFSSTHILREMKQEVNNLMAATGRTHHMIVELDLNDNRFINPLSQQGFGMDAQWVDEFHHALRVTAGEPRNGYYADFDGLSHLAKSYKDAYVFDGLYSPHRKKTFGIKAENNPGDQFIVFSQNHDQVGNRMLGDRTSTLVSFDMQKLMAAAVFVSPFIPMLFMGEEYSEPNPFQYFVSHTDPELAEAVRKGRKAEFSSFHSEGEAPDPMSVNTFNNSKLQWNLLPNAKHSTMFQFYKTLISLRKSEKALNLLNRNNLSVEENIDTQVLRLHRWHQKENIICFLNFSEQPQEVMLPSNNTYTKLLASSDPQWNGHKEMPGLVEDCSLTLAAELFVLYKNVE